jgi:hypothetical protein
VCATCSDRCESRNPGPVREQSTLPAGLWSRMTYGNPVRIAETARSMETGLVHAFRQERLPQSAVRPTALRSESCWSAASVLPAICQKPCIARPHAAPRGLGSAGSLTWTDVVRCRGSDGCLCGPRCVHTAEVVGSNPTTPTSAVSTRDVPGPPGEGLPSPLVVAMLEMACAGIGRLVHGWGGGGHAV